MPTLEELGQKVKAKYPQYANVPDAELGAKVKAKYPDAYKDFTESQKTSVSQKAKERLASMIAGPAKAQFEKAQTSATQDIKRNITTAVGETAAMAPFAIAAPFTAGTSLGVGAAIMGGAGLVGGALREGIEAIGGKKQSLQDLALTLGVDTAFGAGGEALGRGLSLGKTLLPKLLERAAVRSDLGKVLVEKQYAGIRSQLDQIVGKRLVDVEAPLRSAYRDLEKLPLGKGAFGEQFTGLTAEGEETATNIGASMRAKGEAAKLGQQIGKAKARQVRLENVQSGVTAASGISQRGRELIKEMESRLEIVNGKIASRQPLDALIEIKGNLSQKAYKEFNVRERPIFRDLAGQLDQTIKRELAGNPEAAALYEAANEKGRTLFATTAVKTMAEKFIYSYGGRLAGFSAVGAGAGYYYGGRTPLAAATGAAAGAGLSVGVPKLATLILQQTAAHPQAMAKLNQAVEFALKGDTRSEREMAERAFVMAGVRETIKEYFKQPTEPELPIGP